MWKWLELACGMHKAEVPDLFIDKRLSFYKNQTALLIAFEFSFVTSMMGFQLTVSENLDHSKSFTGCGYHWQDFL